MKEAYARTVNSTTPIRNAVLIGVFDLLLMFLRLSFRMHKEDIVWKMKLKVNLTIVRVLGRSPSDISR